MAGRLVRGSRGERDHSCEQGRQFLLVNGTTHDLERRRGRKHGVGPANWVRHSGMFPCFFGGNEARLVRSARSARTTWARVSDGSMTAST